MADNKDSKPADEPVAQCAVIDENGEEVPITDEMIQHALDEIKPQSIGWKTGMMEAITDDMLEEAEKQQQDS